MPVHASPPGPRWAIVSTYPPTQCGIATFTQSLRGGLTSHGATVDVLRLVGDGDRDRDSDRVQRPAPGAALELVVDGPAPRTAARAAADTLNTYDVVVVQHEYGIYGGEDGSDLVDLMSMIDVPVLTVLHTVLAAPTAHQRDVLQSVVSASDVLVTMTRTAHRRLLDAYAVDPSRVVVIPHGAADDLVSATKQVAPAPRRELREPSAPGPARLASHPGAAPAAATSVARPVVLTWGLIGQGKGIEWAVEGIATLRDLDPRPLYVVAGQTHPRVLEREGEKYRRMLEDRVARLGCEDDVVFHNDFLGADRLHGLVRSADVVLLPYDSREQVTSGVLIEAVAAGRPVVSTRFPHAVELLGEGSGLLVDQRDPQGIADALRRVLTEPGLARRMTARSVTLAPSLSWSSVAGRYLAAGAVVTPRPVVADTPMAVLA
jgi:glycosyltransferase involved in cell wall biosynthesis